MAKENAEKANENESPSINEEIVVEPSESLSINEEIVVEPSSSNNEQTVDSASKNEEQKDQSPQGAL